jgi:ATP-dependent Clp protease protease subunit
MPRDERRIRPYPAVGARRLPEPPQVPWELAVTGDLGDKQTDTLERLVEVPRRSRGILFFDTCGGSVYAGLSLATLIRLRGLQVTAVVLGECSSAALVPFAACRERFVTPHSTLLFHPIRWQSEEDVRLEEAAEWARHFQLLEEDVDRLLVEMFECDAELIRKWTHPGRFVNGSELVEAGLARLVNLTDGDFWRQTQSLS